MEPLRPAPRRELAPCARQVESFDGTVIHFDLYDAESRSLILIVPGFWRDRRHPSMINLATLLLGCGYRAAVVDVRGHGDSSGVYGFNLNEHHDVAAVAREILRVTTVETLSIIGLSVGGAIAVSTVARHALPVSSLMLISPVADFARVVPRINPFTIHRHIGIEQALRRPRFDWLFATSEKLRAVDDITEVELPLSLIHVKNDWLVDHHHSEALFERANEPKELHIIDAPGNYHADRIFSQLKREIEPLVTGFFARFAPR